MKTYSSDRSRLTLSAAVSLLAVAGSSLLWAGCGDRSGSGGSADNPTVKVCYLGLTCEPPIFVAYEKGFFKEEGLNVELVKADWKNMRDLLGLGQYHACHHLTMYLLKPIESGADIKITGGIHTGCLRLQAGIKTDIKKVEDLKGKRIAVSNLGSPPFLFAGRVLAAHGMDPMKDVLWQQLTPDTMELALDRGTVDAVASAEPIGTILISHDKVRKVADQAIDPPYDDEFCCVTAVNSKWAAKHPEQAAKVTRAMMKGAKWVQANPQAAAELAVEKKYVAATAKLNAQAIMALKYMPGVAKARRDLLNIAREMKGSGFLPHSEPEALIEKAWLPLEGVTDEWIKEVKVDKVAGGGPPPKMNARQLAALFNGATCCEGGTCLGCCGDLDRGLLPLTGAWARVPIQRGGPLGPVNGESALVNANP